MKIAIASGKGGVGKSMLTASLAVLFSKESKIVACDCDVDSPNLEIWLGSYKIKEKKWIYASRKARIISQNGLTEDVLKICRFGAIEKKGKKFRINSLLCEGCGICAHMYPKNFKLYDTKTAEMRVVETKFGFPLIEAQLLPGEKNSGKVVEELKKKLENFEYEVALLDSAAGIGCPVIASIKDVDFVLLVTEPMPAAQRDLQRVIRVVNHFNKPFAIVINKSGLNNRIEKKLEKIYKEKIIGKIGFEKEIVKCLNRMEPAIFCSEKISEHIRLIYSRLKEVI